MRSKGQGVGYAIIINVYCVSDIEESGSVDASLIRVLTYFALNVCCKRIEGWQ